MIKYVVKRTNSHGTSAYGKYYAHPVVEETIDLADLARHMEEHNSGFSEAMCVGVMKAMVKCIKEQLLEGKNVKIDDLAIFSVGIRNKEGAATPEEFSTSGNIAGVKLRARATGTLSNANLNLSASIKKVAGTNPDKPGNSGNTGNTDNTDNGGNTDNSGNSGNTDNGGNGGNSGNTDNSGNTGNSGNTNNTDNGGNTGNTDNSGNTDTPGNTSGDDDRLDG